MSETKNPGEKKLTLSLKPRTETGVVRQSFSHGRSKQVVVEKVKRRAHGPEGKTEAVPATAAPAVRAPAAKTVTPAAPSAPVAPAAAPAPLTPSAKPSGVVLRTLTDEERNRRAHALGDARLRE